MKDARTTSLFHCRKEKNMKKTNMATKPSRYEFTHFSLDMTWLLHLYCVVSFSDLSLCRYLCTSLTKKVSKWEAQNIPIMQANSYKNICHMFAAAICDELKQVSHHSQAIIMLFIMNCASDNKLSTDYRHTFRRRSNKWPFYDSRMECEKSNFELFLRKANDQSINRKLYDKISLIER